MYTDKLPLACATRHPIDNKPILLRAGVKGYFPAPEGLDPDTYNRDMQVTPAQRRAMECGALFGFDVPGANPDFYAMKETTDER